MLVLLPRLPRPHLVLPATKGWTAIATHRQFRAAIDAGDLRRATWVAGDQPVLIEDVIDTTRRLVAPGPGDYISLTHTSTFDRDVWAHAHQYPMTPGATRLILVRDADKLTRWDQLDLWLSRTRQLPGVYLLLVSGEPDLPWAGTGSKRTLKPHVAGLKAPRGYLVRCTQPSEDDAVAFIRSRSSLDHTHARHLLTRTGGNLAAAAAVCTKLALFEQSANTEILNALTTEQSSAGYTEHLIALDKRQAMNCAQNLPADDYFRIIALLDSRLDLLHKLNRTQIAGQTWRDTTGINPFLQRRYQPHARHYDATACARRRRILALADDVLRNGARTGVLELIASLW